MTAQRTVSSRSTWPIAFSRPAVTSGDNAFMASGRFSLIHATGPSTDVTTADVSMRFLCS